MALPTLTQVLGAWETVTTPASPAARVVAFKTMVGTHSKLTLLNSDDTTYVHYSDTNGAQYVYLDATPNGSQVGYDGTIGPNIGMAPEGGTFTEANVNNATGPFGVTPGNTTTLWSGYCTCMDKSVTQMRCLANDDYHFIAYDSGAGYNASIFGAWIEAPTVASGHKGTSERIYAASIMARDVVLPANFWGVNNLFMGYFGPGNAGTMAFNPASPSSAAFTAITRRELFPAYATVGALTTADGTRTHLPISYKLNAAPQNLIGFGRQVRVGEGTTLVWQEGDSGESIIFAPSPGTVVSAIAFDQSR